MEVQVLSWAPEKSKPSKRGFIFRDVLVSEDLNRGFKDMPEWHIRAEPSPAVSIANERNKSSPGHQESKILRKGAFLILVFGLEAKA